MERRYNNVTNTDNKASYRSNNNVNDNGAKYAKAARIQKHLAPKLAKMLDADEGSMNFLYKCFWKLSEARIWSNAEIAMDARKKMALFIYLCKKDGV